MQFTLKDLMAHLGIDYVMMSYTSDSHQHFDPEQGLTCSAEVRMGPEQRDLEAEIQMFYDDPPPDKPPIEQIMIMKASPRKTGQWEISALVVKGEPMTNKFPDWDKSACEFYTAVTYLLKTEQMPNIDGMIDEYLDGEDGRAGRGGRARRGGGRKNPKFKPPSKTPGMKQGM